MTPIGSLQLTAEECNEILMKRAVAAVQANNQQHTITTTSSSSDGHNARNFVCALFVNIYSKQNVISQQFPFKFKKLYKLWRTVMILWWHQLTL